MPDSVPVRPSERRGDPGRADLFGQEVRGDHRPAGGCAPCWVTPATLPAPDLDRGKFSAAAVGSYEREFRWPTVERLALLCSYYGVPLVDVLAGHPTPTGHRRAVMAAVDEAATAQETRALRRLATSVTCRRTGPTRHSVATGLPRLRHGDLEVLAVVLDTSAARLRRLAAPGVASGLTDATKASDETEKRT